jgi:hypothetical protein
VKAALLVAWVIAAAAILWLRTPESFGRWPNLPSAISLETYLKARRAPPPVCLWSNVGPCWTA